MSHTNHETKRKRREDARFVRWMARSVLHWRELAETWERLGRPDNAALARVRAGEVAERAMTYCVHASGYPIVDDCVTDWISGRNAT